MDVNMMADSTSWEGKGAQLLLENKPHELRANKRCAIAKQKSIENTKSLAQRPVGNPFDPKSSVSKSIWSRWSLSLPRSSQQSLPWCNQDNRTPSSSQMSLTSTSLSPLYRTPLSSNETIQAEYKIPEYTFIDELQRRHL